jgi:hypothetical protein
MYMDKIRKTLKCANNRGALCGQEYWCLMRTYWYDDMIWYDMIWYDIFVNCNWVATRWQLYSTHLHTNNTQNDTKQTIHRTTQNLSTIKKYGRVRAVPRLGELYPGICLTTEEKARKNLSQGSRTIRMSRTQAAEMYFLRAIATICIYISHVGCLVYVSLNRQPLFITRKYIFYTNCNMTCLLFYMGF